MPFMHVLAVALAAADVLVSVAHSNRQVKCKTSMQSSLVSLLAADLLQRKTTPAAVRKTTQQLADSVIEIHNQHYSTAST